MLTSNKNPCSTCPYRKDVPSGVWHYEEYEKLRGYDDNTALSVFMCHQSSVANVEMACKGWVMVHQNSVAVRLACMTRQIDHRTCFEPTEVELYESGNAAADAGQRHIKRPRKKALKVIEKLKKIGKFGEGDE